MTTLMTAPQLYALSQETPCKGPLKCHWCAAPCEERYRHDEPLAIPFTRWKSTAKYPPGTHVCLGCFLWRRTRVTVTFRNGTFRDVQAPAKHSWFVVGGEGTAALKANDFEFYPTLLKPPCRFVLALTDGSVPNHLHLATINDLPEIKADTALNFTFNNIPLTWTVYELDRALNQTGRLAETPGNGTSPGVQALLRFFGPKPVLERDVVKISGSMGVLPVPKQEGLRGNEQGRPKKFNSSNKNDSAVKYPDGRVTQQIVTSG